RLVFGYLNVPTAEHKVEGPAHSITFLGVNLDTRPMQARLPPDKLTHIRSVLQDFTCAQGFTKKLLQSLLGKLNVAMKIISQGRSFISCLLVLLSRTGP
ncbi:hypothetical protein AB205_0198980, partial [Aquarana catesbeiana]